jgi:DNA-binding CsgD family transcriptional regulator
MLKKLPLGVLLLASAFFIYDIVADIASGSDSVLHIAAESLIFVLITTLFFQELRRLNRVQIELGNEKQRTARLSGELVMAMRSKFSDWELTQSESEVALLLIKGLTMQQIADARGVKEKTVRQQAASVYAKSDCAGRHELAAYFIEDLLTRD